MSPEVKGCYAGKTHGLRQYVFISILSAAYGIFASPLFLSGYFVVGVALLGISFRFELMLFLDSGIRILFAENLENHVRSAEL